MKDWNIDSSWTLFLDRDGVINTRKMGGYIESVEEFQFLDGAAEAIASLSRLFGKVVVVTNQQGIGKGIMTACNLNEIHRYMIERVNVLGGRIDKCYHAPDLASETNNLRKPKPGMALIAQKDFPSIDFSKSIMVGDSNSDIEFGINLGMKTVRVLTIEPVKIEADLNVNSLNELATLLLK